MFNYNNGQYIVNIPNGEHPLFFVRDGMFMNFMDRELIYDSWIYNIYSNNYKSKKRSSVMNKKYKSTTRMTKNSLKLNRFYNV